VVARLRRRPILSLVSLLDTREFIYRRGRVVVMLFFATVLALFFLLPGSPALAIFESGPVRPLALSPDGSRLFYANTPDGRLEILRIDDGLVHEASVRVGLDPVAVAARNNDEVWVVNHISDSVSIVDVASTPPRVVRTLKVGDEPQDIVFASGGRAFVTAAHRGQNTGFDPGLRTPGIGRADVWVFDPGNLGSAAGGSAVSVLSLFGDSPRALAVSPDGTRVYAAVFKSGNRTTTVSAYAVCPGGADAPPCERDGRQVPGGLPAPNVNFEGIEQPHTGLIVRYDGERDAWLDEIDRDWSNAVPISLPDFDVFEIDAVADPPLQVRAVAGVGTVIYNLAVHPVTGRVFATNTEARNDLRFEPRVRGRAHASRITVIDGEAVMPRALNKHIDYDTVPSPAGVAERSLALPTGMAFAPDGRSLFVAAFGSDRVGEFAVDALEDDSFVPGDPPAIPVSGGGPSGLVVDAASNRMFVATRFDNGVSEIDIATRRETAHTRFFTPEPDSVVRGRRWLYDARSASSNGEAACASCHVFADTDDLAWDLGDPDAPVFGNPNPVHDVVEENPALGPFTYAFHPLKGPLVTQTLRGLAGHGPMHWRGDRTGAFLPEGDFDDERAAFAQFNPAFVSLLGAGSPLSAEQLSDLTDFVLAIVPGPNPIRPLDNSLTPDQARAREVFTGRGRGNCDLCHTIAPAEGLFGTNTLMSSNGDSSQVMKVPSLRQIYRKVGMFGLFPARSGFVESADGPQVRGFGFEHDGAAGVFIRDMFDFVMAFDTNFAPVVGQQVTLTADSGEDALARLSLLLERRGAGECDLVASGAVGDRQRGWLIGDGRVESDRSADSLADVDALLALAKGTEVPLTFSAVPPATGEQLALDRDGDGERDGDEIDAGTDPADPGSLSGICAGDCNRDRQVTVDEIVRGVQIALGAAPIDDCGQFDVNRDSDLTVDEIILGVRSALEGCATLSGG
jgi:DNA-binding beta-propeller fold protein YncE